MSRRFYALSDRFKGEWPSEYASGAANTREVIFFPAKKDRDYWLKNTKLLGARALTRREAFKWADRTPEGLMARRALRKGEAWVDHYDREEVIRPTRSKYY